MTEPLSRTSALAERHRALGSELEDCNGMGTASDNNTPKESLPTERCSLMPAPWSMMPFNSTPGYEALVSQLDLTAEGALQVDTLCQSKMRLHCGQHKSITTPEDLHNLKNLVAAFHSVPHMLNFWRERSYGSKVFDQDFVRYI